MTARAPVPLLVLLLAGTVLAAGDAPPRDRDTSRLVRDLEEANPAVRVQAAVELGRRRASQALVPLVQHLTDPEPEVRVRVVEALRQIGDERAVPRIARRLTDPDDMTRCRAVLALGELGEEYVLPSLRRMLRDGAVVVRAAAVRAIGEIRDPLSLDDVLRALADEKVDTDGDVTAAALVAAARIAGPEGLARARAIAGERIEPAWFLRASYARAVAVAGDEARVPLLVKWLETDVDPRVTEAAAGALAVLGRIAELERAAELPEVFRRRAAVAGLGEAEGPRALAALYRAVSDEDPGIVLEAATVLLARGQAEAIPVLVRLLDAEPPFWIGAMAALQERTGLDLGRNPPAWLRFWEENRERLRFDPKTGMYEAKR